MTGAAGRVGMLAPMQLELQPIVRELALDGDGTLYRGQAGDVEVVAMLTRIGMAAAEDAARRMLGVGVDQVVVVGIAGGVDPALKIGDVVVPEVVIDRRTDRAYRPATLGGGVPRGTLSCGDELVLDPDVLGEMLRDGVIAVDMETAAVAAVCDEVGCPWSVFRGISDFAGEGLIDDALFALTRPDGTADQDALTRYLEEHPERTQVLIRLAHDTNLATEAAAAAAISACTLR